MYDTSQLKRHDALWMESKSGFLNFFYDDGEFFCHFGWHLGGVILVLFKLLNFAAAMLLTYRNKFFAEKSQKGKAQSNR